MWNSNSLTYLAEKINALDVQNYARATGWKRVDNIPGDIAIYRRPESEFDEILVPQDPTFVDYGRRMTEVISALAQFENRNILTLLNDLLLPPSDIIRFVVESADTKNGTASLNAGIDLFIGARKALLASACSVIQPQSFHPRMSRAEAEQFVESCRLGTEAGSFVASLICPLNAVVSEETIAQTNFFGQIKESFTRKVTLLLVKSADLIVQNIKHDSADQLIKPRMDQPIISDNLCEALISMQPTGDRSLLKIIPTWSRTAPVTQTIPSVVRIPKEYFPTIEKVAQELRPKEEPKKDLFIGRIDALYGKPSADGLPQGEVTFVTVLPDNEILKAKIDLLPEDYAAACDAHKYTLFVELHGVLHRGTRIHRITDCENFRVRREPLL